MIPISANVAGSMGRSGSRFTDRIGAKMNMSAPRQEQWQWQWQPCVDGARAGATVDAARWRACDGNKKGAKDKDKKKGNSTMSPT